MPKRSHSWNDCPQQMKTHIGQMEVAKGVAGKEMLDEIHRNTQKLLLEGAKKYYSGNVDEEDLDMNEIAEDGINNNAKCTIKQMDISTFFGGKPLQRKIEHSFTGPRCRVCSSCDIFARCSFCELLSCVSCLRTCSICTGDFCALCAIVSYESKRERAVCLNCSK